MKIAVIGGSAIGFAAAGHMALRGEEVRLYEFPQFRAAIEDLEKDPMLEVVSVCAETGLPEGGARLAYAGTDARKALEGADLILVAVPAYGEGAAAEVCAPWVRQGQHILLLSGYIYGSVEFAQRLRRAGCEADVTVTEMNNSIYAARKTGGRGVRIGCYKHGVGIASFPGKNSAEAFAVVSKLYPEVENWHSILATGVSNPSLGVHVTSVVFNPRYVEEGAQVFMYENGRYLSAMGDSVARVNLDMDAERLALDGKVGRLIPWRYVIRGWYAYLGVHGETLPEIMSSNPGLAGGCLPTSFDHRFLTEDVCMGLWPLVELLELYGLPCGVCRGVAVLASSLSGLDLEGRARTLKSLGLGGKNAREVEKFLYEGL